MKKKIGENSLDILTSLGVNANAYTTNNYTAYLFECTDNFYKALDELTEYIQNPYFTDENVEKEKGIIIQEINMYEDNPESIVYMNLMKNMYKENPIKSDIIGTKKSVNKINKDILYKCYNTFYRPNNMTICVAGDFDYTKIINEIEKRITIKNNTKEKVKQILKKEPNEIVKKTSTKTMKVSIPIFMIGIKDSLIINNTKNKENKTTKIYKSIAIEILLNILAGESSELYKKLYKLGILKFNLGLNYEFSKDYSHIIIEGQSKNPNKVLEEFKNKINYYKEKGINKEDFSRIKNMLYGKYIKEFNDVFTMSNIIISDYFKGINSFDYVDIYNKIDIKYVNKVLNEVFTEDKMTISVVKDK